ncbi:hypothetical protein ACHAW6_010819 [Cyclotella cf. meneghiniana]
MSLSNQVRPGAMSLLDKYAQINANIEEARRRVTAARSELESTNHAIENLRDKRQMILQDTQTTKGEFSRIEKELRGAKVQCDAKLEAKERVEREYRFAKHDFNETRRRIDDERLAFLERCREFRSSCKRMRVAATILVLDGGAAFDVKGDLSETDVWRRLQDDDVSSDEEDGIDAENTSSTTIRKGDKKKTDMELEQGLKDEKESREAFIEAECALHAARSEHEEAVKRCNARNQKLIQQRAQLERHRKEVEDLERDIGAVNDEIVKANQESKTWKTRNASNSGSYSCHFNPPPEYNHTALHKANNPPNAESLNSSVVSNPYKSKPSNPYQSRPMVNHGAHTARANTSTSHQYASEVLKNSGQQNQNRTWSSIRNQRQFGTAIDLSADYSGSQWAETVEPGRKILESSNAQVFASVDDLSVSSSISSDDDIISFDVFGKKDIK